MVAARLVVSLLVAALALTAGPRDSTVAADPIPRVTVVQSGLVIPWDVAFAPDGTMFVTERPGRIRVYASGAPGAALVSTVNIPSVRAEHESGVNGIVVDRNFASNRFIYVCASRDPDGSTGSAPWVNQVLRYRVTAARTLDQMQVIFTGGLAATQHNGCSLRMDAGGFLWVGIGDGAVPSRAQDPNSLNGKIFRMTRDGAIPADNPILPGADAQTQAFSMGHRNPQGIGFEPGTGRVYASEHGPNQNDEINHIRAGLNYGWPCYTGADTPFSNGSCGPATDYTPPAWASGTFTIATSGMTFLDHALWGSWRGSAIVAQLKQQDLRRFVGSNNGATMTEASLLLDEQYGRLRAAVQAPDGALYVTTSNGTNDMVLRVVPGQVLIDRYAGADRYATAAVVSRNTFGGGAPIVYVATGANYPDALTGGAAASRAPGPVLLVTPSSIPQATRTEIGRLRPQRIVVLGGTGVISASVQSQLHTLAPGGASRLAGADRYETAAVVSRATFGQGVPVAYIATGADYPDALGAVPAAGVEGGPILLVRPNGVPGATRTELTGTSVTVSDAVPLFPATVAVMVALPAEVPVTTPVALTVATDGADELQLTVRPEGESGFPRESSRARES